MSEHQYTYPTVIELRPDSRRARSDRNVIGRFIELIQELLDAHCDTLSFEEPEVVTGWAPHLAYLKDLQRVGQQSLAELANVEG
jgi:hypothetical protein